MVDRLIEAVELFEDVMVFGTEKVLKNVKAEVWEEYSPEQIQMLKLVSKNGPLPAGKFAELQGVHKSAITSRLKKLEEKKVVEILRAEEDHRTRVVHLTEEGRRVVMEAGEAVYAYVHKLFADQVNEEELDQFLATFRKIKSILKV